MVLLDDFMGCSGEIAIKLYLLKVRCESAPLTLDTPKTE